MATGSTSASAIQKSKLREQFRNYRRSLSDESYERLSALIVDEVKLLPEVEHAQCVHLYWPIIEQREIDTRPLFPWFEARGTDIILPKVLSFDVGGSASHRLSHVRYPGEEELEINKWGIAEPQSSEAVEISILDLVIVPAVGAGRNGYRVGHGYGYYDEFLAASSALTVGLVYDACLVESVPNEPHDVPLDILISEREVIRVSGL